MFDIANYGFAGDLFDKALRLIEGLKKQGSV